MTGQFVCAYDCGHRTFTLTDRMISGMDWCAACGRYVGVVVQRVDLPSTEHVILGRGDLPDDLVYRGAA